MENMGTLIPGFGRYKLDLVTHNIISNSGNNIKTRVDERPNRGQTVVTLFKDSGKKTTVNYHDLVKKTVESLEFTPRSASILSEVLVCYYEKATPEFRKLPLLEATKLIKKDLPELEMVQIGRVIQKIHGNA